MVQPENEQRAEKSENDLSIIMFIILFLVILVIAFSVYLKSQNVDIKSFSIKDFIIKSFQITSQDTNAKVVSEFKYDFKEHSIFNVNKDYILKFTKDSVAWLNTQGEEQKVKVISTENPVVKIAGAYILIADIGGKDFYVINGLNIKWTRKSDGAIINADISKNGFVSIVKEKKGYKGAVDIYDDIGNLVFTTVRAGSFILLSKVLGFDDKVLINSVDTTGINANTILELINMRAEPLEKPVSEEDVILPCIWNLNGDFILGVSDNILICYDMSLNKKWKRDFTKIYSSNIALGKYLIIAVQSDKKPKILSENATEVKIIGKKGVDVATYRLDGKVVNIESSGNIIALNTGTEVHFINTAGKIIGKYISKSKVMGVHFINKQKVMVETRNSILTLKIGG